jgi:hypothetical protein
MSKTLIFTIGVSFIGKYDKDNTNKLIDTYYELIEKWYVKNNGLKSGCHDFDISYIGNSLFEISFVVDDIDLVDLCIPEMVADPDEDGKYPLYLTDEINNQGGLELLICGHILTDTIETY